MLRWISRHYRITLTLFGGGTFFLALFCSLRPIFTGERPAPVRGWLIAMIPITLWLFLWVFSCLRVSSQAFQSLNRDCDPEPLLDHTENILRQAKGKHWRATATQAQINRAAALVSLGRSREALEALDPDLAEKGTIAAVLWLNRAAVFCDLEQAGEMVLCLDRVQALLDRDPSIKPNQQEALRSVLQQNRLDHRFLVDGPSPALEAEYEGRLSQTSIERLRVDLRFTLARCALARGDRAAAREHLDYVLAHGNKLHVRTRAQELLKTIPAP